MTIMHYKAYEAVVEFDEAAKVFHGKVINLPDVLTFEAKSAVEIIQAFGDCVENYLLRCQEDGEDPDPLFSGEFLVHAEPDLHKALTIAARRAGIGLNEWVTSSLKRALNMN